MSRQDFALLVESGLLTQVEQIVVDGHHRLYSAEGREWSPPVAYRWLRYENPTPVARLIDGTKRLQRKGVELDADAVDKACVEASKRGFLNSK